MRYVRSVTASTWGNRAGGRRLWFSALALTLILASHAAEAQPARQVPRIGLITAGSANLPSRVLEAFRQGLRDIGWVEGQNMTLDVRYADGHYDRMPALAAELVKLKVDVIVAGGTAATVAARNTTKTIPIVMIGVANPVALGVVTSLARPGGNVTGLAYGVGSESSSKGLELLKEAVPRANRVAVLWSAGNPSGPAMISDLKATASALGLQLQPLGVRGPGEFEGAFAAMARERADALLVISDAMFSRHHASLAELAMKARLPSMHGFREYVEVGSLMSYGTSVDGLFRRAPVFVDRILRGAKPADLPVEQPTQFELVINLKTARALGLAIPQSLVLRAEQVIE
jgi:putative ABC transport system substrate-binding protein